MERFACPVAAQSRPRRRSCARLYLDCLHVCGLVFGAAIGYWEPVMVGRFTTRIERIAMTYEELRVSLGALLGGGSVTVSLMRIFRRL